MIDAKTCARLHAAAMWSMTAAARAWGFALGAVRTVTLPGAVELRSTRPDGREFGIGYSTEVKA